MRESVVTVALGSATSRGPTDTENGGIGVKYVTCAIDGCEKPAKTRGWCSMHYSRWKANGDPLITKRPTYGAGRFVGKDGYVMVRRPGHPLARANHYVLEHRLVLWEAGIDSRGHDVHHKNENKQDNRLENLDLLTARDHTLEHHPAGAPVRNQFGEWQVLTPEQRRERNHRFYLKRKARLEGRLF